jgi:hypothetical protein
VSRENKVILALLALKANKEKKVTLEQLASHVRLVLSALIKKTAQTKATVM